MTQSKQSETKQWHVARWPLLAWLETVVKLAALAIGILALVDAVQSPAFGLPAGARLAQLIILAVLSLGLVAAIWDRLQEREIVAMVFVVLNNLGHWGMVIWLLAGPTGSSTLISFAGLMLAGDLIKLVFLRVHNFQVRDTPRAVLYGLTLFYVVGYIAVLVLAI